MTKSSRIVLSPRRLHQSGRDIGKSLFNTFKMIPMWGKIHTGFGSKHEGQQPENLPFGIKASGSLLITLPAVDMKIYVRTSPILSL